MAFSQEAWDRAISSGRAVTSRPETITRKRGAFSSLINSGADYLKNAGKDFISSVKEGYDKAVSSGENLRSQGAPFSAALSEGGNFASGVASGVIKAVLPKVAEDAVAKAAEKITQTYTTAADYLSSLQKEHPILSDVLNLASGGKSDALLIPRQYQEAKDVLRKVDPKKADIFQAYVDFAQGVSDIYGLLETGIAAKNLGSRAVKSSIGAAGDLVSSGTKAASQAAGAVSDASTSALKAGTNFVGDATVGVTSRISGLEPSTIESVIQNPERFANLSSDVSRSGLQESVGKALQSARDDVSDLGSAYNEIRKSNEVVPIVPEDFTHLLRSKYGLTVEEVGGKFVISAGKDARPLTQSDITAIQDWMNNRLDSQLTGNQFLNTREALADIRRFDQTKSSYAQDIADDFYDILNQQAEGKISGLRSLDATFAPIKKELDAFIADWQKGGEFRSNAMSKLANATNKNNVEILKRLETYIPGITQEINILRAGEDIERALGNKTAIYGSTAVAAAGFAGGGVPGMIAGFALSYPKLLIPALRLFGRLKGYSAKMLEHIVEKIQTGKKLSDYEMEAVTDSLVSADKSK